MLGEVLVTWTWSFCGWLGFFSYPLLDPVSEHFCFPPSPTSLRWLSCKFSCLTSTLANRAGVIPVSLQGQLINFMACKPCPCPLKLGHRIELPIATLVLDDPSGAATYPNLRGI